MTTITEKTRKPKSLADSKRTTRNAVSSGAQRVVRKEKTVAPKSLKAAARVAEARPGDAVKPRTKAFDAATALTPPSGFGANNEKVTVLDRMARLLDQPLRSESDVVRMVDAGLPAAAFARLTRSLDIDHTLIAPESTIRRRVQDNMRFTTDESERMVRIARIHALAVELFGDEAAAQAWLNAPGVYVPGAVPVTPYKLSVTDAGARLVEERLLRTAHGVF